jgi:hypothetical protein
MAVWLTSFGLCLLLVACVFRSSNATHVGGRSRRWRGCCRGVVRPFQEPEIDYSRLPTSPSRTLGALKRIVTPRATPQSALLQIHMLANRFAGDRSPVHVEFNRLLCQLLQIHSHLSSNPINELLMVSTKWPANESVLLYELHSHRDSNLPRRQRNPTQKKTHKNQQQITCS